MNHTPAPTNRISGISFAAVTNSTSRAPKTTPRMLTNARPANSTASSSARPAPDAAAGQTTATDPANALATDATAKDAISQKSTPARKPTKGPNATPTYAYKPPVNDTRLPAEAKHKTMSAISVAQTRYAIGAAGPRNPATIAGSTKMPAPIVTFTMLAVSRRRPMARTSAASAVRVSSSTRVTRATVTQLFSGAQGLRDRRQD